MCLLPMSALSLPTELRQEIDKSDKIFFLFNRTKLGTLDSKNQAMKQENVKDFMWGKIVVQGLAQFMFSALQMNCMFAL